MQAASGRRRGPCWCLTVAATGPSAVRARSILVVSARWVPCMPSREEARGGSIGIDAHRRFAHIAVVEDGLCRDRGQIGVKIDDVDPRILVLLHAAGFRPSVCLPDDRTSMLRRSAMTPSALSGLHRRANTCRILMVSSPG